MSRIKNLIGQKFGRLTVIKRAGSDSNGRAKWLCKCSCENESVKIGKLLLNGHCKSCGCGEYENRVNNCTSHKLSNTRLYNIWSGMKQRCYYTRHISYHTYGGRGITVCDEWKNDFKTFYDWAITHGYRDDLSIDRIDVNGNYEPNNCRWATNAEQSRNVSNNVYVTLDGETRVIMDWCKILSIPYHKIYWQIQKGLTPEKAFEIVKERCRA